MIIETPIKTGIIVCIERSGKQQEFHGVFKTEKKALNHFDDYDIITHCILKVNYVEFENKKWFVSIGYSDETKLLKTEFREIINKKKK